jgi:type IV pilus assembly protein PilV
VETNGTDQDSREQPSDGFSLIEVMVAMCILGIGLLAVAQMIPVAMAGVTQAGVRTRAVQAAQEQLDDLRSNDWEDAALGAGTYSESQGNYTLDWTITDDDPVERSKRIDITASWVTASGTKSATLRTYISEQ